MSLFSSKPFATQSNIPKVRSAIILAGGLGTRLQSVLHDLPKPMAPVNGRPFLKYLLDYWITQGIEHFVLSVGYKHQIISSYFKADYKNAKIEYAIERSPLGTGGGLLLAMEKVSPKTPFLLLNGDTYFTVPLRELEAFHFTYTADWTFSVFPTVSTPRYLSMTVDQTTKILSLKPSSSNSPLYGNGGIYLVNPKSLAAWQGKIDLKISLEDEIIPSLLSGGAKFCGFISLDTFIDIGIPDDYAKSQTLLK